MATGARAYTVKSGDTLWGIAHRTYGHGALWPVIFVYNQRQNLPHPNPRKLVDPDRIYINQVIYLPDRIDPALLKRGPGQVAVPGPIRQTGPAVHPGQPAKAGPQAGLPGPASVAPASVKPGTAPGGQGAPARAGGGLATLLNDFSVRYDVSTTLLKRRIGQVEVEIQFKGYIALRHDKLVPASTFTNKAYENQRKMELGHALGDLIATRKLKVEWRTGKIEYECLLTAHLASGKPAPISTGIALDNSVPPLAWRTKIDLADAAGHWRDIIYRTENLTITITVRWKPDPKSPNPPASNQALVPAAAAVTLAQAAPAPAAAPTPAPVPPMPAPNPAPTPAPVPPGVPQPRQNDPTSTPDTGDQEGESWVARQWHWVEHHPAEIAAAVVVAAVVVAAAPEIAAAVGSGILIRGAATAAAAVVVTRMATPTRPSPGV